MDPHYRPGPATVWNHFSRLPEAPQFPFVNGPVAPQLPSVNGIQSFQQRTILVDALGDHVHSGEDVGFDSGPYVIGGEVDDASSVATDDDAAADAFPNKEFAVLDDLRASVQSFVSHQSFKIGDNPRTRKVKDLQTKWLKAMFEGHDPQDSVRYSGFFYCMHKHDECGQSAQCKWRVPYKLKQNGTWISISDGCCWEHSHDVSASVRPLPSASGLVHLRSVNELSVEHKATIVQYLDAMLTIKRIRALFRQKFIGFELRARTAKSVKQQYLAQKYGADRHQMDKLLEKLQQDCNPAAGGFFKITHFESLELCELYFQMPLLRAVGQYFGKFSVIDMTHNTTMYQRNLATLNVRPNCFMVFAFVHCVSIINKRIRCLLYLLSVLKPCYRLSTIWVALPIMLVLTQRRKRLKFTGSASNSAASSRTFGCLTAALHH